jgi:small subunit ribosomal protein S5
LVGIKDIRVTIEGRTHNKLNILKAFLVGLLRQRTHQELANEKRLHLVEMRAEMGNFPVVVASPEDGVVRTEEEIGKDEILDFEAVSFDGHYARIRAPFTGFKTRHPIKKRRDAHIASHAADRQR